MSLEDKLVALAQAVGADIKAIEAEKAEKLDVYTKTEVDAKIGDIESALIAINGV